MKKLLTKDSKGQMINAEGALSILVLIFVIGYIINVGISLNADSTSLYSDELASNTNALAVAQNSSERVTNAYGQASNLPSIYVAILMIGAILSILVYLRYYR